MSGAGKVFVITGPSGVGKGTLIGELMDRMPELELSVSATTRDPRPGESDGVSYHFLSPESFGQKVAEGEFLEHANYSSQHYGTLREEVTRRLEAGRSVVLEIELQGARQIRESMPDAVQIFIAPPGEEALRKRLESRGTDSEDEIGRRLDTAKVELAARDEFKHVIVNDDLDTAVAELHDRVRAELSE